MKPTSPWIPTLGLLAGSLLAPPAPATPQEEPASGTDDEAPEQAGDPADTPRDLSELEWKVFWRNGLRVESEDGDFWIRIGGRLNMDWGTFGSSELEDADGNPLEDGTFFRRARLELDGLLYGTLRYRAHFEFAGAEVAFRDLWGEWTEVPLRVGRFREPMGLEANTSSNALTFLERSVASITLTPGRNSGVMYRRPFADDNAQFFIGAFRQTDEAARAIGDDGAITGRVTWLPYISDDERHLVHLGLAATARNTADAGVPIGVRLEAFFPGRVIDITIPADAAQTVGAELAWGAGPWSFQTEFLGLDTDGARAQDAQLWGTYAQFSWFLTGEHRPYKRSRRAFGTITPLENFSMEGGGKGAIELAGRWSKSDLTDVPDQGDVFENFTVGANWYANPSLRVQLNWIHSVRDRVADDEDLFMARFQVTF